MGAALDSAGAHFLERIPKNVRIPHIRSGIKPPVAKNKLFA